VGLFILIITLRSGDTSKNRKIAGDLLEYHRRWNPREHHSGTCQFGRRPHSRLEVCATSGTAWTTEIDKIHGWFALEQALDI